MNNLEATKEILAKWKFPILGGDESHFLIRYKMKYVQINFPGGEDSDAVSVSMSGILNADDDRKMQLALRACNEVTHRRFQAKCYIDMDNDVIIASEFFCPNSEELEYCLRLALEGTVGALKAFQQVYSEQEEELRLIEELDNEE